MQSHGHTASAGVFQGVLTARPGLITLLLSPPTCKAWIAGQYEVLHCNTMSETNSQSSIEDENFEAAPLYASPCSSGRVIRQIMV